MPSITYLILRSACPSRRRPCGGSSGVASRRTQDAAATRLSSLRGHLGQIAERRGECCLVIGPVFELAGPEVDIGLHVEMAVAAQVEQNRAPCALFLAAQRL